jgi:hypothetical protein
MEKIIHKHDIVEFAGYLSEEECQKLVAYYDAGDSLWQQTCFYNARVMDPFGPKNQLNVELFDPQFFHKLRESLGKLASDVMGRPVRNLTVSAHKWLPGAYAGDHADNAELDGTPNAWQDNKLVTIIYLNDNYEGGNLTFRDHGISIAPKAGTAIVFDVGIGNVHAVTEVTSGERYTMLLSWDYDDIEYPEGFLEELARLKMAEQPKQDAQKEQWNQGSDARA